MDNLPQKVLTENTVTAKILCCCPRATGKSSTVKTFPSDLDLAEPAIPYLHLEPAYVTGLCEGEGRFTYGRQNASIRLRFAVKLPETDKALVFALKRFFGVGRVYGSAASWQYCATDTYELQRVAEHFDAYPLKGLKGECYGLWRRMLRLKLSNEQLNWAELQELALQLSSLSLKGRGAVKHNG